MSSRLTLLGIVGLVLIAAPVPASEGPVPQDDGASGADAPDSPVPLITILSGSRTGGTLMAEYQALVAPLHMEDIDYYAFEADAGDIVEAKIAGFEACVRIVDGTGATVAGDRYFNQGPICAVEALAMALDGTGPIAGEAVTIPAQDTYYLAIRAARNAGSTPYEVTLGIDEPAPTPLVP